jgi:hypothetical protein
MPKKHRILLIALVFAIAFYLAIIKPARTRATSSFTNAYIELSNSRFSYRGGIGTGTSATINVTIDTTSDSNMNGDINTYHLFPNDRVCFTPSVTVGCRDNKYYTIANIIDADEFSVTETLGTTLTSSDLVIASQSGQVKFYLTTTSEIPAGGNIIITIPAVKTAGKTNDTFPDTQSSITNNGFDLNGIAASDLDVTGCTDTDWNHAGATITPGNGSTNSTIIIPRTGSACTALSNVAVIIDSNPGLLNPSPAVGDVHSLGVSDIYKFNVKSRNSDGDTLDESNIKAGPTEGVLVTANVDETLSFTVAGVTADSGSYCGITRTVSSPDTSATAITWGTTLSPSYNDALNNTQQKVSVTTNAVSGFKVYIEENDQMGRNGNVCTGTSPSAGEATFGSGTCIKDTVCGTNACSHIVAHEWGSDPSSYPGFGYSLQNDSGDTSAMFVYNSNTGTGVACDATTGIGAKAFCAKQMADVEGAEDPFATGAEIMTASSPVDDAGVFVCYRIDITGLQPSGYYYNKVAYTAVPKF